MERRIELWAFRYYDPLRRRWIKARYRARREEIAARHQQYRIEGDPEVREGPPNGFVPPTGSKTD